MTERPAGRVRAGPRRRLDRRVRVIGRRNHDEGAGGRRGARDGGAVPDRGRRRLARSCAAWRWPMAIVTGLVIWPITILVGMMCATLIFDRGTAVSFVIVATLFLGVCLLGWRLASAERSPAAVRTRLRPPERRSTTPGTSARSPDRRPNVLGAHHVADPTALVRIGRRLAPGRSRLALDAHRHVGSATRLRYQSSRRAVAGDRDTAWRRSPRTRSRSRAACPICDRSSSGSSTRLRCSPATRRRHGAAGTIAISTCHSGRASAGTVTSVDAARRPSQERVAGAHHGCELFARPRHRS